METDQDKSQKEFEEELRKLQEEYSQIFLNYKQSLLNLPRPPHPFDILF